MPETGLHLGDHRAEHAELEGAFEEQIALSLRVTVEAAVHVEGQIVDPRAGAVQLGIDLEVGVGHLVAVARCGLAKRLGHHEGK